MDTTYQVNAVWTNDAQGKKDYDGVILRLSTRYWPRGGGYFVVSRTEHSLSIADNTTRPEIRPSATSTLLLESLAADQDTTDPDTVTLLTQDFVGETFEDVAQQVEAWAQDAFARVIQALQREFPDSLFAP